MGSVRMGFSDLYRVSIHLSLTFVNFWLVGDVTGSDLGGVA